MLETLEKRANELLQGIEKRIETLTVTKQELDIDSDMIQIAERTNKDNLMFSVNVQISKKISKYGDVIKGIRNGMQIPQLNFQTNKTLTDLFQIDEALGKIESSDVSSSQQGHVDISDMKVKSKKEFDLTLPDDRKTPDITGCTFLPNGNILLCDYLNRKMKLLDSDMVVKKSLMLSNAPYNVAAVSDNEAIITFGHMENKDLQYINTQPSLKLGNKITLQDKCYGLKVLHGEIYTCCHKDSGHDEILRLDRTGNIISKIVLTQASSGVSGYLGLCLADSNPRVYLADWYNNRVTCFQLDYGKMEYQYEDKGLRCPQGIYVDSVGNSLVCGSISNNVVVITADGRKHGELPTNKGIFPKCVDYRPEDNTLIAGCERNSKLFVYTLGK